ncbi:MAG TPA: hypothetical protein PLH23_10405 [Hyphomonadaceae bacterium]|nr:hypothetical protein [Hyphomonadaceae bacterium]
MILLPCSEQAVVYQRASSQLDSRERGRLRRLGKPLFDIGEIEALLAAISLHWTEQRRIAEQHPDFFRWPSTVAWMGSGGFWAEGMTEEGALKLFGYNVGQEADLSEAHRRQRLDLVFNTVIPPFTEWSRVLEWGEPRTAPRLKKMANCLASFARNGARRPEVYMQLPVRKWRDDLGYLHDRYYRDHFRFGWPDVV